MGHSENTSLARPHRGSCTKLMLGAYMVSPAPLRRVPGQGANMHTHIHTHRDTVRGGARHGAAGSPKSTTEHN
jgi:hypothetical protein